MFWIAETGSGPSKTQSAWDSNWVSKYGGVDDPHRRNGLEPTAFRPRKYAFQKQALLRRNHLPQKNNDYLLTKRILSVPQCIVLKEFNFRAKLTTAPDQCRNIKPGRFTGRGGTGLTTLLGSRSVAGRFRIAADQLRTPRMIEVNPLLVQLDAAAFERSQLAAGDLQKSYQSGLSQSLPGPRPKGAKAEYPFVRPSMTRPPPVNV
jgi:hypothetical protein